MHEEYLGDSYDLVKRFFSQSLRSVDSTSAVLR